MAIWQFAFSVIPSDKEIKYHSSDKKVQNIDDIMSWHGYSLKDSSIKELCKILKPSKSWSDDIKLFGHTEETCIELFYEGIVLDDVSIRLDLRNLTTEILEAILSFIDSNNAVILTSDGSILKPVIKEIIEEVRKSEAHSFLSNPDAFLSQIKENKQ
jgi:hypothetical protein